MVNSLSDTLGPRGLSIEQQKEIALIQSQAANRERSMHAVTGDKDTETSLYVGELSPGVDETVLKKYFPTIKSAHVCRDSITHKSLGYAYLNFQTPRDCAHCLKTMNYTLIEGKRCRLMYSERNPSKRYAGTGNIFVKNLPVYVEDKGVHDTFSQWGTVTSCRVLKNSMGQSKGCAYVSYDNMHSAERAIEACNGGLLFGRELIVGHQVPKSTKEAEEESGKQKFTNLYVKNISPSVTEQVLQDTFSQYGPVSSLLIQRDESGQSKGFGFINYEVPEDAERALNSLHDIDYHGKRLFVSKAQKKSEREDELRRQHEQIKTEKTLKYQRINLYVKNLADNIHDDQLKEIFSPYGTITSAKVMKDESTGLSKGFGFVCFTSSEDASRAVSEMNSRVVSGKAIYVALAQRKEDRRHFLETQLSHKGPFINPAYQNMGPVLTQSSRISQYSSHTTSPPLSPLSEQSKPIPAATTATVTHETNEPKAIPNEPIFTLASLEMFSIQTQRQMLGERLYSLISSLYPEEAAKITGILLDLGKHQVIQMINQPKLLESKVMDVMKALQERKH